MLSSAIRAINSIWRYTQAEIEQIAADESYITLYGKLADKFGDNGVVSVVIGHQTDGILDIELWIMSCRVLKRDMEYAMMDRLVQEGDQRNVQNLIGHYYPTAKNGMVKEFYGSMGFTKTQEDEAGNSRWEMAVESYKAKNHVISVK